MLAPRHLIFTALEGALLDPNNGSFTDAEEALGELHRRGISLVLLTSRTRAEIEPLRRKLGHGHPFVTENGGGIFIPDGYFNIRIPGGARSGRYFCVPLGRPYDEVCVVLDEIAEESKVGVAGFHHMSPREIAENTGLRPRDSQHAADREFDEPFFFTSANEKGVARFVAAATQRGFNVRPGNPFWRLSSGCDAARAVRTLTQLFREASHIKLRTVGVGSAAQDFQWLAAVDHAVLLPSDAPIEDSELDNLKHISCWDIPGPAGWNASILNLIS